MCICESVGIIVGDPITGGIINEHFAGELFFRQKDVTESYFHADSID